jgi:peroxiredoxin
MGGLPYPELSDWHPKGMVVQAYDLWNDALGAGKRAVVVVDRKGVVRYRKAYGPGTLPNPAEILEAVENLD